ncbi:polycystic kidney disease 2-like 2 protein [Drosophila guanche]|uniref:Blast:Polycystic kidney disease 2-like 1 protein n=1 Tax=Drosophila guanche TaxID=7266 RepID=A0A3B0JZ02_DROGU|nr:polycystic kidney disease 2-like 2 protein [Drosophila guanche]SPP86303.1 blast:Polycystic kidney disease 2-like 1 protein [Drosophila guanche]
MCSDAEDEQPGPSPRAAHEIPALATMKLPKHAPGAPAAATPVRIKVPEAANRQKRRLFRRKKVEIGASQKRGTPINEVGRETPIPQHVKVKSSRILYTTDEEVREALVEFGIFIIFLFLTSLVTLSVRHSHMFYFNDTIKKLFVTRNLTVVPSVTVSFEKMLTVPDWWDYLIYNFVNTLHGDMTDNLKYESESKAKRESKSGKSREKEYSGRKREPAARAAPPWAVNSSYFTTLQGRMFLQENLLLGPPRLRQIRVSKDTCHVDTGFTQNFNICYPAYSVEAEENSEWHKESRYHTMGDLGATPIMTLLAYYRSGGYTVDLTYDKQENLQIINKLKTINWLDRGSRLCLLEFNLFSDNKDIFQSVKLIAEIPPTGGVIPQAHLQTVKEYSFFTDLSLSMTVVYIFWYIMVFYYTIYEINEMYKSGFKKYYKSLLNILDNVVLVLSYIALVYNIWHTFRMKSILSKARAEESYQSIDYLCLSNLVYVDMMAVLAFLVWIKIFKFISFNKTLIQFTTTLRRCSKDLIGFSILFGIVFLAYAQLGLLLFGAEHPDFHNFVTAVLTMIRMILGDFQYNLIQQSNRVLGPIYFLTYIVLVFFILLNMFLAIIMQTYNAVKNEITQGRSQLASYVYKKLSAAFYWVTHCGRKRRLLPPPRPKSVHKVADAVELTDPKVLRKNMTKEEARYFEEIPHDVNNRQLYRVNNRVSLIEEVLEQLVANVDNILQRFERERGARKI